jgi:hypothetical protein
MEKQKEYILRYLLAKVRTTRGKASDRLRQRANKRNKNCFLHEEKRRTGSDSGRTNATKTVSDVSDIGAEQENHTVGRGPT